MISWHLTQYCCSLSHVWLFATPWTQYRIIFYFHRFHEGWCEEGLSHIVKWAVSSHILHSIINREILGKALGKDRVFPGSITERRDLCTVYRTVRIQFTRNSRDTVGLSHLKDSWTSTTWEEGGNGAQQQRNLFVSTGTTWLWESEWSHSVVTNSLWPHGL